jgi:hypothetical protein
VDVDFSPNSSSIGSSRKAPLRGALLVGAISESALAERLRSIQKSAEAGHAPGPSAPAEADLCASERLAIDYREASDLADKSAKALTALAANQAPLWKLLRAQGIFRGQAQLSKASRWLTHYTSRQGSRSTIRSACL